MKSITLTKVKAGHSGKRAACTTQRIFPQPIADSRRAWARDLRALRHCAPAHARRLRGVEKAAWQVALAKARFLSNGSGEFRDAANGARLSRAQASRRLVVDFRAREGTGRAVEWAIIAEMHAAARAEIIAARLADPAATGITAANRAANRELHHAAREHVFSSAAQAEAAAISAHRRALGDNSATPAPTAQPQPHAAEFLVESGEEHAAPTAILTRAMRRARTALAAFYAAKSYPRARKDHARDLRALRAHARSIQAGEVVRAKWRDDKAASERARDLAARVQAGIEILAAQPATLPICAPLPAPAPRETILLPVTRNEWTARDVARSPFVARLMERAAARRTPSAAELADLAAHFAQ